MAYSVQQTSDSGYILAGKSASFGNILGDMWVLKLKSNGDIDWQKSYEGNNSNSANFILQTQDGGYILAGETSSFGAGNADMWVLKTDKNGNVGSGCSIIGTTNGTVASTGVNAVNSSGTSANTSTIVASTPVAPQDSGGIMSTQCSFP
jgi:cyclophilin family peptidyl-prolyl cis-trans isomerase